MNFTKEQEEVMVRAINHFGKKAQKIKAIEELSELSVELAKDANKLPCNIIEEFADVCIMMNQLHVIFMRKNLNFELLLGGKIAYKLERLKKRMDEFKE